MQLESEMPQEEAHGGRKALDFARLAGHAETVTGGPLVGMR